MTDKDIYKIIDATREDMLNRHPEWQESIETICATISYEFRKFNNERNN